MIRNLIVIKDFSSYILLARCISCNSFSYLLFSKLCQHNLSRPRTQEYVCEVTMLCSGCSQRHQHDYIQERCSNCLITPPSHTLTQWSSFRLTVRLHFISMLREEAAVKGCAYWVCVLFCECIPQ